MNHVRRRETVCIGSVMTARTKLLGLGNASILGNPSVIYIFLIGHTNPFITHYFVYPALTVQGVATILEYFATLFVTNKNKFEYQPEIL